MGLRILVDDGEEGRVEEMVEEEEMVQWAFNAVGSRFWIIDRGEGGSEGGEESAVRDCSIWGYV